MYTFFQHLIFRALDHARCSSPWLLVPLRELLDHDALGGHLCARHIAQTHRQIQQRLSSSGSLAIVSTFWSFDAARAAVCYLTVLNLNNIVQWANDLSRPRFSVEGNVPVRTSIGYAVVRSSGATVFCNKARMVLQRNHGTDFVILTAFPIP